MTFTTLATNADITLIQAIKMEGTNYTREELITDPEKCRKAEIANDSYTKMIKYLNENTDEFWGEQ